MGGQFPRNLIERKSVTSRYHGITIKPTKNIAKNMSVVS